MTTLRTFIAVELPEQVQDALATLQNRLKTLTPPNTVRWTAPQNIHLTLHFLGNVPAGDVEKISHALQAAASGCRPLGLTVGKLGCFPNTRRPRIIWAGILGDTEELARLHASLGEQLKAAIDFTPESRPYTPHLTIGRVKKGVRSRHLSQLGQVLEQEQANVGKLADLHVTQIALIKSELKPTGAVYTPLSHGSLNSG